MKRSDFLRIAMLGTAGVLNSVASRAHNAKVKIDIGVCTGFENWDVVKNAGCAFVEEGVGKLLMPHSSSADFKIRLDELGTDRRPAIRSFIYFLPSELKSVGPDANHEAILTYASTAFERTAMTGARFVVFGSGGSRRIPDGFSRESAEEQFVSLCSRLAPAAARNGVILAVEQLNRGETNFINTLGECVGVVRAVNHPNLKMVCDIYHALKEGESPEEVIKCGNEIVHCHIAEKEGRTAPGVAGDDFTPFFRALKRTRYRGGISIESTWKDLSSEIVVAVSTIQEQYQRA